MMVQMNKYQLSQICEVKKGQSITKKKITEGTIPVVAGGQKPAYYHNEPNRTGNIITVSASGAYAGFVNYFEEPIFASDCSTIKSLDENNVLTKYVLFILKSQQKQIYNLQRGAGQPHVYPKELSKIEILVPKLEIQKQIVSILEKAESLKQKREQTNKQTQKIIQSIFYDMFGNPIKNEKGFEIVSLEEVAIQITDGVHFKPNYTEEGIPFISVKDITTGKLLFENCKFISKNDHLKYIKRCKPEYLDILYTKVGATYGRPAIVDKNIEFSIYVSVALIKPNKKIINPLFLKEVMATSSIKMQADRLIKGIGVPDLHLNMIKKILIPLPGIDIQNKFVNIVEKIEFLKEKQQSSTQEINILFDALMQKAFNGELVV